MWVEREDMVRRRVCSAVKGRLVVGNIPVNEGRLGGAVRRCQRMCRKCVANDEYRVLLQVDALAECWSGESKVDAICREL